MKLLNEEQQKEIIAQIRTGDILLREKYIMYLYTKVEYYVKNLDLKGEYAEDCIQVAMQKVIEMIDNYKFKNNISLTVYHEVHKAIADYLASFLFIYCPFNKKQKYLSVYEYLGKSSINDAFKVIMTLKKLGVENIYLSEIREGMNSPEEALLDKEVYAILKSALKQLTPKQLYVVIRINGWLGQEEKFDTELAKELNCTRKNIKSLYACGVDVLKRNGALMDVLERRRLLIKN